MARCCQLQRTLTPMALLMAALVAVLVAVLVDVPPVVAVVVPAVVPVLALVAREAERAVAALDWAAAAGQAQRSGEPKVRMQRKVVVQGTR